MGGVNNTDLRKRGFFAYVISTRGLTEGARAIRLIDRSCETTPVGRTGVSSRFRLRTPVDVTEARFGHECVNRS